MAEKRDEDHWMGGAVRRPGREKNRAKENGVPLHQQMEQDSHSKSPSLRGAGLLGLRLQKGHGKP
jgi:hypothetical protein